MMVSGGDKSTVREFEVESGDVNSGKEGGV